jgi:peptidoglycan/xylan/chitin deacetylase (PgdA/CDA1 family)
MKHLFWIVLWTLLWAPAARSAPQEMGPLALETYPQTILITFTTEQTARRASLKIVPLYHDFRAAFSTRMDDNNIDALTVAEVMTAHGQKGTFFLNDAKGWQGAAEAGVTVSGDAGVEVPERLLAAGNSIGCHTMNHEFLPALSKNAVFKEIMALRIQREVLNHTHITSFAYPFVSFHCESRDPKDREDIEESLRRSGIFLLAENKYGGPERGFFDGYFVIADGQSWNGSQEDAETAKERPWDERPLFLVTMHPWVKAWGGAEFPKLTETYEKWEGRKDWWYCNMNQYAAYRTQALRTILDASVEGKVLKVVLARPRPSDLGDWVPLTFQIEGVKKSDMLSVVCAGSRPKPVVKGSEILFDLPHASDQGTVEEFASSIQDGDTQSFDDLEKGPGGLKGLLVRNADGLTLELRNQGPGVLRDIRVTFRLPLAWKEGVQNQSARPLAPGGAVTLTLKNPERSTDPHDLVGSEYLVAQVDYRAEKPSRLYVVDETSAHEADAFFARNGFWVLGPLAGDMDGFDPAVYAEKFLKGHQPARENKVPWGASLGWKIPAISATSFLDPDIIPTTGKDATPSFYQWDQTLYFPHKKVHYMLWGNVESAKDQDVRVVCLSDSVKAVSLNGKAVEGETLHLKKGVNDLRILYAPAANPWSEFSEKNYGCYLRLTDDAGARVENVRFVRPALP